MAIRRDFTLSVGSMDLKCFLNGQQEVVVTIDDCTGDYMSMKTKEMRVGDYYIDKESKELCRITPADLISLNYIDENDDSYIPIPLTKEVFFILTYGIYNCVICNGDIKLDIHKVRFIFTPDRFGIYSYEAVSYLHQLQNLYYTMTRWELPIDENRLKEYVKTIEL